MAPLRPAAELLLESSMGILPMALRSTFVRSDTGFALALPPHLRHCFFTPAANIRRLDHRAALITNAPAGGISSVSTRTIPDLKQIRRKGRGMSGRGMKPEPGTTAIG
jgi:hypothetical protein